MKNLGLYKFLKIFFLITAILLLISVVTQYISAFVYYDYLLKGKSVLDGLNRFLQNLSLGLLAFVLSRIFDLLITRDIKQINKWSRLLKATVFTFAIFGIVRFLLGINNLVDLQSTLPNRAMMIPLTIIHIIFIQSSPIIIAITVYVLYRVLVELVQFEAEVV